MFACLTFCIACLFWQWYWFWNSDQLSSSSFSLYSAVDVIDEACYDSDTDSDFDSWFNFLSFSSFMYLLLLLPWLFWCAPCPVLLLLFSSSTLVVLTSSSHPYYWHRYCCGYHCCCSSSFFIPVVAGVMGSSCLLLLGLNHFLLLAHFVLLHILLVPQSRKIHCSHL